MARPQNPQTKLKLLAAALSVVRRQGYAGTTVEDICVEAGVSKGAFFHHFASKEELAVSAAHHWSETTNSFFSQAPYHGIDDPMQRILDYVRFRRDLVRGSLSEFTCFVGTLTQEVYETSEPIRKACWESISGHADTLVADISAAMELYGIEGNFTAESLALHTQAVIQGAFILAKASDDPERALESIDHLHRYLTLLFRSEEHQQ